MEEDLETLCMESVPAGPPGESNWVPNEERLEALARVVGAVNSALAGDTEAAVGLIEAWDRLFGAE